MQDWQAVQDFCQEQPLLVDTTSSPTTVYERRNIKEVAETLNAAGETVPKHWEYEQRTWTLEEWVKAQSDLNSPLTQLMMQQLSDIQMNQELNELTAQEERQLIAQSQSDLELAIAQMEVGIS